MATAAECDENEEPLFADDLDDFLDEDVPPLPPPLSHDSTNIQATPTTSQPPTTQGDERQTEVRPTNTDL